MVKLMTMNDDNDVMIIMIITFSFFAEELEQNVFVVFKPTFQHHVNGTMVTSNCMPMAPEELHILLMILQELHDVCW